MIFPALAEIVELNQYHIKTTGGMWDGGDNLRESGSLEWVLDAIQYPLFGVEQYPTIEEKAAQLAWIIIDGHVFHDANKRTGMSAMFIFLRVNAYVLLRKPRRMPLKGARLLAPSDSDVIQLALNIASQAEEGYTVAELVRWIRGRLTLLLHHRGV